MLSIDDTDTFILRLKASTIAEIMEINAFYEAQRYALHAVREDVERRLARIEVKINLCDEYRRKEQGI